MSQETKGCKELISEVIEKSLCCLCGACAGSCPYLVSYKGRIVQLNACTLADGQCYQYCPRTPLDMDDLSRQVFGQPYSEEEMGTVREVFMARSRDAAIKERGQYGGTVTTLLSLAMEEGLIDRAVLTRTAEDKTSSPFVAGNTAEALQASGSNYMASSVLEVYNRLPEDNCGKLAVVGVPCQVLAIGKMKTEPPRHRCSTDHIALVIGLFCTWALSPAGFQDYLKTEVDFSAVKRFDIPPPPANRFDVYTSSEKKSLPLEQVRKFIMPTCAYCLDMTAEFADVSVGSVEGVEGWNTVIIRTEAGARLLEKARSKEKLEIQFLPADKLAHLKEAALIKKKRALKQIIERTGDRNNLLYLGLSSRLAEKLLS
jgi:coenzyme F420 hydrogenase subunit beta